MNRWRLALPERERFGLVYAREPVRHCRGDRSDASARTLCSPTRSRIASSPGSSEVRVDNERSGPCTCQSKVRSLAPDLAHGAVAGLLGEGETRCWLYARRLPKNFVDRRNRVFRADGVLYGNVEVGEETRMYLAVRRQA